MILRARSPTAPRPATRDLLEWIAAKHGVEPDRLLATNGSMQADAFLFQAQVEPGDLVVVEAPTYDRTLLALRSSAPRSSRSRSRPTASTWRRSSAR